MPKRVGRQTVCVTATLSDRWRADCDDEQIAAQLEHLKPEYEFGYLPPPTQEWARSAERVLRARIVKVETSNDPEIPGLCMSGGPVLLPVRAEGPDGTVGDGAIEIRPGHPEYERRKAELQKLKHPEPCA